MSTVTFDHMFKRYGEEVVAVNDLNLEVGDGEFICLVGPSGCGKTTALRCVAGLEEISDGRILIGERVVNNVAPKDRDIAMVFQSYALYPHMTVRDNLAFGLKLRKIPKDEIERRVNEAAGILDLGKLLDRKPKELSGGQRARSTSPRMSARIHNSKARRENREKTKTRLPSSTKLMLQPANGRRPAQIAPRSIAKIPVKTTRTTRSLARLAANAFA